MFGYVKPYVPVLRVKEHELYKATYCGLCKSMGKTTGCFSNMTLSYDFVFLALLKMALNNEGYEIKSSKCVAHPFTKRPMLLPNNSLKLSARTSVILTRLKLKDNINDSHGFGKLKAIIQGSVSIFLKKTSKELRELEGKVKSSLLELSRLEKENCDSVDKCAHTFGTLLSAIISEGTDGPNKTLAEKIGYHLGKWIYVMDAYDDFYEDIGKSFNPLVNSYGNHLTDSTRELIKNSLLLELGEMSRAVSLLDIENEDIKALIENITYLGLPKEFENITKKQKEKYKNSVEE